MDVAFRFLSEGGSVSKKSGANIGGRINELLSEFVQRWETAGEVIETTSDGAMGTAFFVQEIDERLLASATGVGNRVPLVSLSEEHDGGEGFDAVQHGDGLVVTRVRIHIGENAVLFIPEIVRDLLVHGFQ